MGWVASDGRRRKEERGERKIRFACVKGDGVFPLLFVVTAAERGSKVEIGGDRLRNNQNLQLSHRVSNGPVEIIWNTWREKEKEDTQGAGKLYVGETPLKSIWVQAQSLPRAFVGGRDRRTATKEGVRTHPLLFSTGRISRRAGAVFRQTRGHSDVYRTMVSVFW